MSCAHFPTCNKLLFLVQKFHFQEFTGIIIADSSVFTQKGWDSRKSFITWGICLLFFQKFKNGFALSHHVHNPKKLYGRPTQSIIYVPLQVMMIAFITFNSSLVPLFEGL